MQHLENHLDPYQEFVNHHWSFHEVSYKDVSSRFNLIIIVLVVVLALVLEIRILSRTKDEYDDDKVRTL